MLASRKAATRSSSMARESAQTKPAGKPCCSFSTWVTRYWASGVKKSGQRSSWSLSMASAYAALNAIRLIRSIISKPHVLAIGFPEATYRGFSCPAFARGDHIPSHFQYGILVAGASDPACHKSAHSTVFHRYEARRTYEVALLETNVQLLGGVVFETQVGPIQFAAVFAFGQYLSYGEAVLYLLQDKTGKYRQNL